MAKHERFDFDGRDKEFPSPDSEPDVYNSPDRETEKPTVGRLREVLAEACDRVVGQTVNHFKTKYVLETVEGHGLIINVASPRQNRFGRRATRHPQYLVELFERNREYVERDHTVKIIGSAVTYTRVERLTPEIEEEVRPFTFRNMTTTHPDDTDELRAALISHVRQATPPLSSNNWG